MGSTARPERQAAYGLPFGAVVWAELTHPPGRWPRWSTMARVSTTLPIAFPRKVPSFSPVHSRVAGLKIQVGPFGSKVSR